MSAVEDSAKMESEVAATQGSPVKKVAEVSSNGDGEKKSPVKSDNT